MHWCGVSTAVDSVERWRERRWQAALNFEDCGLAICTSDSHGQKRNGRITLLFLFKKAQRKNLK